MKASRRLRMPSAPDVVETEVPRIVLHPDGYYWLADKHEVGPFPTIDEARADLEASEAGDAAGIEPGETLHQVEDDIGVENWIDPETGTLAEEQRPRLEDH